LVEGLGDAVEPRVVSDRRTSCQVTAAHGVRAGAVVAIADEEGVAERLGQLSELVKEWLGAADGDGA